MRCKLLISEIITTNLTEQIKFTETRLKYVYRAALANSQKEFRTRCAKPKSIFESEISEK